MKTHFIVNPRSASGETEKKWQQIKVILDRYFQDYTVSFTTAEKDSATLLTRKAIKDGYQRITAVGGDGTLSETVNGFFENDTMINNQVVFSFIMRGRGNDFKKNWNVPDDLDLAAKSAAQGRIRNMDLIKAVLTGTDGKDITRFAINIASFGMSGDVVDRVNQSGLAPMIGGGATFLVGMFQTLISYENKNMTIRIDNHPAITGKMRTVAVANGKYFGGGMKVAPDANTNDGLLDVIIMGDLNAAETALNTPQIYQGTHINHPKIKVIRGKHIRAEAADTVMTDIDGECPGKLPAVFDILPGALQLQTMDF
jgi:diacylglycerol kinase (ATP)